MEGEAVRTGSQGADAPESAEAARPTAWSWSIPLFAHIPLAPLWIWLAITTVWMALYCAYAHFIVEVSLFEGRLWRGWGLTVFQDALLIGYLPAGILWGQRQATKILLALRPALEVSDREFDELRFSLHRVDTRVLSIGAGVAVFVALAILMYNISMLVDDSIVRTSLFERLGFLPDEARRVFSGVFAWEAGAISVLGPLMWLFIFIEGALPHRLSRIAEASARVDLIDLSPLEALREMGLGAALRVITVAVVASVGLLVVREDLMVIGAVVAAPVLAVAALLAAVRGIRPRVSREKRAELSRVHAELRASARPDSSIPPGRLADLIAYENRLEGINTWLFDRRSLLRFGIIVGGGMSMVGGAVVERLLTALLGS